MVFSKQINGPEHPPKSKQNDTSVNKTRNSTGRKGLLICSLNAPSLVKHKDEIEILAIENKLSLLMKPN